MSHSCSCRHGRRRSRRRFMTTTVYELDPTHTTVGFSVRHMMVTQQRGQFRKVTGTLTLNRNVPEQTRIEAAIDVASIDTNVPQRDEHLRSADFFDAVNHPKLT